MSKHVGKRGKQQRKQLAPKDTSAFASVSRGQDRHDEFLIKSNRGSRGKNGGFFEKKVIAHDDKGREITGIFHVNPKRKATAARPTPEPA